MTAMSINHDNDNNNDNGDNDNSYEEFTRLVERQGWLKLVVAISTRSNYDNIA